MGWSIAVIVGILLWFFIWVCPGPRIKRAWIESEKAFEEKEQARRQQVRETEQEKKRLAAVALEGLRKNHFVIHIRERDGRKYVFESILIDAFLKKEIPVDFVTEKTSKLIGSGDPSALNPNQIALVGTAWEQEEKRGGYGGNDGEYSYWIPISYVTVMYCDFRLLKKDGEAIEMITLGVEKSEVDYRDLARHILKHLLETPALTTP